MVERTFVSINIVFIIVFLLIIVLHVEFETVGRNRTVLLMTKIICARFSPFFVLF